MSTPLMRVPVCPVSIEEAQPGAAQATGVGSGWMGPEAHPLKDLRVQDPQEENPFKHESVYGVLFVLQSSSSFCLLLVAPQGLHIFFLPFCGQL